MRRVAMAAWPLVLAALTASQPAAGDAASGQTVARSSYLKAVSCPTSNVCVAVGAFETDHDTATGELIGGSYQAMAVRTTDGGKTWGPVEMPNVAGELSAVWCRSATTCIAVGSTETASRGRWVAAGAVVVRIEGPTGSRVTTLPAGARALDAVTCPSGARCIAAGGALKLGTVVLQPDVMVSDDGGARWSAAALPIKQGQLESISCGSPSHCVAVGATSYETSFGGAGSEAHSKPLGLVSTDGGLSWDVASVPGQSGGPTSVVCQSALHCAAAGDWFNWCWCGTNTPGHFGESWVTDDGGASWSQRALPTLGGYDVRYANALSCWATGCALGGTATTTKPGSAYYAVFQTLSEQGRPLVGLFSSANGLRPQYIDGLSCRDATRCIAVGQGWSKPATAAIEMWASGRWATTFTGQAAAAQHGQGASNWDAHVPRHFLGGVPAMEELSPLFTNDPAPQYMFQGQSYQQFKDHYSTGFTFCAQDFHQPLSRACPDFAGATDPALQQLLARSYPGASEDIGINVPSPFGRPVHLGRSVIGDGSVAQQLGFDMYMGRWTNAETERTTALSLMGGFERYVSAHRAEYGTCAAAYGRHADINLRVACAAYWELEVFYNLYDNFVNLPKLCIAAYGHGATSQRVTAERGCFLGEAGAIASDDNHDLVALDPVPNAKRADSGWYYFTNFVFKLNPTPTCSTSLASFYFKALLDAAKPPESVSEFTEPELPTEPTPLVWTTQLRQIWDMAAPKPQAKQSGAPGTGQGSAAWELRSISCPK